MPKLSKPTDHAPAYPVSRADFAKITGKSRGRVTEACSGQLAPAVLDDGTIDLLHEAVTAWCRTRKIDIDSIRARLTGSPRARTQDSPSDAPEVPPAYELMQLSFGEVCQRFGSLRGFERALVCKKLAYDADRLRLKNLRDTHRVYCAATVDNWFHGTLERIRQGLWYNVSQNVAIRTSAMARAGENPEAIRGEVRELMDAEFRSVAIQLIELIRSGSLWSGDVPTKNERDWLHRFDNFNKEQENDEQQKGYQKNIEIRNAEVRSKEAH